MPRSVNFRLLFLTVFYLFLKLAESYRWSRSFLIAQFISGRGGWKNALILEGGAKWYNQFRKKYNFGLVDRVDSNPEILRRGRAGKKTRKLKKNAKLES